MRFEDGLRSTTTIGAATVFVLIFYIPLAYAVPWQQVDTDISPMLRRSHTMAYDPDNDLIVLFGGFGNGTHLGDTWVFDPKKNTWSKIESTFSPIPRAAVTLVYDEEYKNFIFFGGFGFEHETIFDDVWSFDTNTNIWQQLKANFWQKPTHEDSPEPRASYG